ncbi:MAG: hypothetical protein IT370_02055 [Deltaproteobacteria bacterium]|nr:hypothetical protein [Deltaproteobacteria bacterium]
MAMPTRIKAPIVVAITLGLGLGTGASVARAAGRTQRFLGWSADGAFYATSYAGAGGKSFGSLCQPVPEGNARWPEQYGRPGGGLACVSGLAVPAAELARLVVPPVAARVSPVGVTLELRRESTGQGTIVARRAGPGGGGGGDKEQSFGGFDDEGGKLGDVFWQPTGHAAAFYLDSDQGRAVYRVDFRDLVAEPDHSDDRSKQPKEDPEAARKAEDEAEGHVKAERWAEAMQAWRAAIAADPDNYWYHEGLLLAAARQKVRAVMVAEILWLRTRRWGRAENRLAEAWRKHDLDAWATDKELRGLFGIAPWSYLSDEQRLRQRSGEWVGFGPLCELALVQLGFRERDTRSSAQSLPQVVTSWISESCSSQGRGNGKAPGTISTSRRGGRGALTQLGASQRFPGTTRTGVTVIELEDRALPGDAGGASAARTGATGSRARKAWPKQVWVDWCPIRAGAGAPACFHLRGPGMTHIATFYQDDEKKLRTQPARQSPPGQ